MSKFRILLAVVLCMSLLAFTGCGEGNNADTNSDNGTVTEDSTNMNNDGNNGNGNGSTNGDGSVMEDMENGAEDAVDSLEKDAKDAADGMRNAVDGNNGEGPSNRDRNTKESNVGQ